MNDDLRISAKEGDEYLKLLDLLPELCNEVLLILQFGVETVDLCVFPGNSHRTTVSDT